jgi:hypothetical protein
VRLKNIHIKSLELQEKYSKSLVVRPQRHENVIVSESDHFFWVMSC